VITSTISDTEIKKKLADVMAPITRLIVIVVVSALSKYFSFARLIVIRA
jgi:hypothetical protein